MNNDELVKRARKLVALARRATPGAWAMHNEDFGYHCRVVGGGRVVAICDTMAPDQNIKNARLIAATPEMAELLEQLADRLEKLESWARPMLEQFARDANTE